MSVADIKSVILEVMTVTVNDSDSRPVAGEPSMRQFSQGDDGIGTGSMH
jgi:hypothetical protein